MIYILIIFWFGENKEYAGKAALSIEFNNVESCQAAEAAILKKNIGSSNVITQCAAKGKVK